MSIISVGTAYAVHIGEGVLQDLAGAVPAGVAPDFFALLAGSSEPVLSVARQS